MISKQLTRESKRRSHRSLPRNRGASPPKLFSNWAYICLTLNKMSVTKVCRNIEDSQYSNVNTLPHFGRQFCIIALSLRIPPSLPTIPSSTYLFLVHMAAYLVFTYSSIMKFCHYMIVLSAESSDNFPTNLTIFCGLMAVNDESNMLWVTGRK